AVQAVTRHNRRFLAAVTAGARQAVADGRFPAYRDAVLERFAEGAGGDTARPDRVVAQPRDEDAVGSPV
ncbi:hypothetical protein, partial [Tsukamurella sputi]|uniref:hypothetical protein n=1 Tax=Tsukamurella sputi TaxID=2591848 RepID=UPI00195F7A41